MEDKNYLLITDDKFKKTIVLQYHIDNYFYKSLSINGNFKQLVISYFSQVIDNNKNKVKNITFLNNRHRQTCNKIHIKIFLIICQNYK